MYEISLRVGKKRKKKEPESRNLTDLIIALQNGENLDELNETHRSFLGRLKDKFCNGNNKNNAHDEHDPLGIGGVVKEEDRKDPLFEPSAHYKREQKKEERRSRRWTITKNAIAFLWENLASPTFAPWVVLALVLCIGAAFPLVGESATATISGGVIATLGILGAILFFTPWRAIVSWFKKRAATPPPTPPTKPPVTTGDGGSGGGDGSNSQGDTTEDINHDKSFGTLVGAVVIILPALLLGFLFAFTAKKFNDVSGQEVSLILTFCGGAATWLVFYLARGFIIIPEREFIVIERLGQYYRVRKAGMHILCLPGLIDKRSLTERYPFRKEQLYNNLPNEEIDFLGGATAGIVGECFLGIIPEKEYEFTYSQQNPIERAKTLLNDEVRRFFQQLTVEEALVQRYAIWESIKANRGGELDTLTKELREAGVWLDDRRGVVVSDIILSPDLIHLRELQIEGQKETLKNEALVGGYVALVKGVSEGAKISTEEAIKFVNTQKFLDVAPDLKASVVIVGASGGIQGVLNTV